MWLEGVVWTHSTLLFSILEVNIKLIRNYIKVDCGGSNDLPAMFVAKVRCDCSVTAVQNGCTDIKIHKKIILVMFLQWMKLKALLF